MKEYGWGGEAREMSPFNEYREKVPGYSARHFFAIDDSIIFVSLQVEDRLGIF